MMGNGLKTKRMGLGCSDNRTEQSTEVSSKLMKRMAKERRPGLMVQYLKADGMLESLTRKVSEISSLCIATQAKQKRSN